MKKTEEQIKQEVRLAYRKAILKKSLKKLKEYEKYIDLFMHQHFHGV